MDYKALMSNEEGKQQLLSSLRRIQDEVGGQWINDTFKKEKARLEEEILDSDKNIQGEELVLKRAQLKFINLYLDLPFKLTNVLLSKDGEDEADTISELLSDDPYK